jgi:hypothetical protein
MLGFFNDGLQVYSQLDSTCHFQDQENNFFPLWLSSVSVSSRKVRKSKNGSKLVLIKPNRRQQIQNRKPGFRGILIKSKTAWTFPMFVQQPYRDAVT